MEVWIDGSTTDVCVVMEGFKPIVRPATSHDVTNNEGEYLALIHALRELISMGMTKDIHVMSDSELMLRQMSGRYAVKERRLQELKQDAQMLTTFFEGLKLEHIPRRNNVAGRILERRQRDAKTDKDGNFTIGNLPPGSVEACISSPPWGDQEPSHAQGNSDSTKRLESGALKGRSVVQSQYGGGTDNLGNSSGSTFWEASRQILINCRELLRPGGHAIWVVKRYVRNGKIVEFSDQWLRLCESVDFRLVCRHRAMLTEEYGTQRNLSHEDEVDKMKRCSFFRRLHEAKRPDLAIDWEDVLCLERP